MFIISLHGISIHAFIGLYPFEKEKGNQFELDVDLFVESGSPEAMPFLDYSLIEQIVADKLKVAGDLIETYVREIHRELKATFPEASRVRVAMRKLSPPLNTPIRYAQAILEA